MLIWRLTMGAAIIGALAGLCWLDAQTDLPREFQTVPFSLPGYALMPVLLLLTVLATQELSRFARANGFDAIAPNVYLANVILVLAPWLPALNFYWFGNADARKFDYLDLLFVHSANQSPLWAMCLGVLMIFLSEMRRFEQPGRAMVNIAIGVLCLAYVGLMGAFAVKLRLFWGVGAMASWIITVKMGDIGAYTVGRLVGRRKMSPTISPGKTVEGALGAMVFACLGSWVCFHGIRLGPWIELDSVVRAAPPGVNLSIGSPNNWLIYGIVLGSIGMLGDLAESLLKRDAGCKDSSAWMPGFGGVLDLLDSLLLTAPVAWLCWALAIVGPGR